MSKVKNGWITDENGTKFHYKDDLIHCDDGPAIIGNDGTKVWCLNDNPHREDGPAAEFTDGVKFWFLNGNEYTFEEWLQKTPLPSQEKLKLRLKYAQQTSTRN